MWIIIVYTFLGFLVGLAAGLSYNNKAMDNEIALRKRWEESANTLLKKLNELAGIYRLNNDK
jgi:hypothetical protein